MMSGKGLTAWGLIDLPLVVREVLESGTHSIYGQPIDMDTGILPTEGLSYLDKLL